jgi:hypothetical protein
MCKCVVTCHSVVRSFFIYGKLWLYFADLCQDAASATRILGNTSGIAGLLSLVAARLHLPFLSLKVRRTTFLQSPGQPSWGELSDYIGWTQQRLHLRSFANASSGKINDKLLCSCTFAASLCCENVPIQFCSCYCKLLLSPFVSFCTVSARHTPMYTDSNSMQF